MHIVCSDYIDLAGVLRELTGSKIRHGIFYSSASDDLGCVLASLNAKERQQLEFSDIGYNLILALGNSRKLDHSAVLGAMWMHNIDARYQTSTEVSSWLRQEHPIIARLEDATPMHISIGYKSIWSTETHREAAARWRLPEYINREEHSMDFLDSATRTERGMQKNRSASSMTIHEHYSNEWETLGRHRSEDFECDFRHFVPKFRKDHVIFSVGGESPLGSSYFSKSSSNGACLLRFLRAVSADIAVTKISLTPRLRLQNINARGYTQSGAAGVEPWSNLNLDGTGQIVGVSDTGIDENSCYFIDKVHGPVIKSSIEDPVIDTNNRKIVEYITYSGDSDDVSQGHGSHVCGSIAGYCEPSENQASNQNKYRGMAPKAKLAFFDIMKSDTSGDLYIPASMSELFHPAYYAGARIHSDSWGGGYDYDSFCLDVDEFAYSNPDFLAIFAAGNDGPSSGTILSPALAKNAVAVAASSNTGNAGTIASFSAQGPAPDGRIKPDITTPGNSITSASAGAPTSHTETCAHHGMSGTSMATPVAAGTAALIRQYFHDVAFWPSVCEHMLPYADHDIINSFTNFDNLCVSSGVSISGAMLKALMLQSGNPMPPGAGSGISAAPPDNRQGFGHLQLTNVLIEPVSSPNQNSYIPSLFLDESVLYSFSERTYHVSVTSDGSPLRATLSWFDPPNPEFSARVVLHDLDLVLTSPSGEMYIGNYKGSATSDSLSFRDESNNNEQISVSAAEIGVWTLQVQSKLLTQSPTQMFSVVLNCAGYVNAISENAINPHFFDSCMGLASPVDFAMFDFVSMNGWSIGDYFSVSFLDRATGVESVVYTGSLTSSKDYSFLSSCLSVGSYRVDLILSSSTPEDGVQLEIPQCGGLFLAPLAMSRVFTIDAVNIKYESGPGSKSTIASSTCLSSVCNVNVDSVLLNISMFEAGGVGWMGAYIAVHEMSALESEQTDYGSSGILAETLEWGFFKTTQIPLCIPSSDSGGTAPSSYYLLAGIVHNISSCYLVELSAPTAQIPDLTPQLAFDDAYYTDDAGEEVECPYEMDIDTPIVTVCLHNKTLTVTFFSTAPATQNYGQWSTSLIQVKSHLNTAKYVGACFINTNVIRSESNSSETKAISPTPFPSSKLPSYANDPMSLAPSRLKVELPTSYPSTDMPLSAPSSAPTYFFNDDSMLIDSFSRGIIIGIMFI